MVEGLRDAFVENDAIGNISVGAEPLVGVARINRRKRRKKSKRKNRLLSRKRHNKRKHSRRKHHPRRSAKIKYTKNGQPYKIMPNGRARFIKK